LEGVGRGDFARRRAKVDKHRRPRIKTTLQGIGMAAFLLMAAINTSNHDYGKAAVAVCAALLIAL
jgi:hypothetical protein